MAAYQVLARKYRPTRFSDVVGQDHVTRTLLNALSQNRIAHGYIFSGHRGIGKTTIARILASALNCRTEIGTPKRPTPEPCNDCESCLEIRQGNAVDVIEIDAATNRGIDEIRELRDAARYRPSRDKYKIYILDEAHQITDAAFNALLKTLEEPPDHIVFMMATTQPEDIPQTIRSRCQHFSFHAVKLDDIVGQLQMIATAESIVTDEATLSLLAEAGDGSMRDALSIMDQAIASAPTVDGRPALDAQQVRDLMGTVSNVIYEQILEAVSENNSADVLAIINRLLDAGNGAQQLARQFVRYLRNTTVAKITGLSPDSDATGIASDLLQISPEERKRAARSATLFTEEELSRFLAIMLRTFDDLGFRQEQRFHLELGLLKLVHVQRLLPVEDLLSQLGPAPNVAPRITLTSRATPAPAAAQTSSPRSAAAPVATPRPAVATAPPAPIAAPKSEARAHESTASAGFVPGSSATPAMPSTEGALALSEAPAPSAPPQAGPQLVPTQSGTLDLEALQNASVDALAKAKGQQSASDKIADSTWTVAGDAIDIQTTVSKTMLPLLLNADALSILKSVLAEHNVKLRLNFIPGSAASAPAKPKRAAAAGSVADMAAKHPVVQQAQQLFNAEIRNVIDLRDKD
jgi:DNA polymerase-3 subunit gamma/tau